MCTNTQSGTQASPHMQKVAEIQYTLLQMMQALSALTLGSVLRAQLIQIQSTTRLASLSLGLWIVLVVLETPIRYQALITSSQAAMTAAWLYGMSAKWVDNLLKAYRQEKAQFGTSKLIHELETGELLPSTMATCLISTEVAIQNKLTAWPLQTLVGLNTKVMNLSATASNGHRNQLRNNQSF